MNDETNKPEEAQQQVQEAPASGAEVQEEPKSAAEVMKTAEGPTPDQRRMAGEKQTAENPMGIAAAQEAEQPPEPTSFPSFFVDAEDRHRVEVDILFNPKSGSVLSVSNASLNLRLDDIDSLGHSREWFEFTLPAYEDIVDYRRRAAVFNPQATQLIVDKTKMRDHYLVLHLKDWSLCDKEGTPVPLEHGENGALTDDSLNRVYRVSPVIMDVVLSIFEKDILIT